MNIQIFGKPKCFASKNAERFFKERRIHYQFINVLEKGLSPRELDVFIAAIKDITIFYDEKSPIYEKCGVAYIERTAEEKKVLLLENPGLLVTPLVRDCDTKVCAIGDSLAIWKSWIK